MKSSMFSVPKPCASGLKPVILKITTVLQHQINHNIMCLETFFRRRPQPRPAAGRDCHAAVATAAGIDPSDITTSVVKEDPVVIEEDAEPPTAAPPTAAADDAPLMSGASATPYSAAMGAVAMFAPLLARRG